MEFESLNFGFEKAIELMHRGCRVARSGWSGKGMFIFTIAGGDWDFNCDVAGVDGHDTGAFICIKTSDNKLVPWVASQTDMLSADWCLLPAFEESLGAV